MQYTLRREGASLFERMRKRLPASAWQDVLKALFLYAHDVLADRDVVALVGAAAASPSNDLALAFEEFMQRCAFAALGHADA